MTAIWFTEVAPDTVSGKGLIEKTKAVNTQADSSLQRLALKLGTGAGKTTVLAMLIAWRNADRDAPIGDQVLHERFPDHHARAYDQGLSARLAAQRFRALLRQPHRRASWRHHE